jgi:hypothetical protein
MAILTKNAAVYAELISITYIRFQENLQFFRRKYIPRDHNIDLWIWAPVKDTIFCV